SREALISALYHFSPPCKLTRIGLFPKDSPGCEKHLSATLEHGAKPLTFCYRRRRIKPVFRLRAPYSLDSFRCFWSRAQTTVKPTTAIPHCRRSAGATTPVFRAASLHFPDVVRRIPILQPSMKESANTRYFCTFWCFPRSH